MKTHATERDDGKADRPALQCRTAPATELADARALPAPLQRQQDLADNSPQAAQLKKLANMAAATGADAPAQLATEAAGNGLSAQLSKGIQALSGVDVSDVRVHRNSSKPAQLNALAYAQGQDIHLAPGQDRQLPHEAWHVVQQRQGRVQATTQLAGVAVNDDAHLEREADVMGERAARSHAQAHSDS